MHSLNWFPRRNLLMVNEYMSVFRIDSAPEEIHRASRYFEVELKLLGYIFFYERVRWVPLIQGADQQSV